MDDERRRLIERGFIIQNPDNGPLQKEQKQKAFKYRSCDSKKSYATFGMAMTVAARIRNNNGTEMKVYHCKFCNQHHLAQKKD